MPKNATYSLTGGPILPSLLSFAFPVLLALFLQAMYGAADLISSWGNLPGPTNSRESPQAASC